MNAGDKFSPGINDTSEQLSPVTTTLAINYCRYQRYKISARGVDSGEQFIAGVVDTGDKLLTPTTENKK